MYRLLVLPIFIFLVACGSLATSTPSPEDATLPFPTATPAPVVIEAVQPPPQAIECTGGNVVEKPDGNLECILPNIDAKITEAIALAFANIPTAVPLATPEPVIEPVIEPTPLPVAEEPTPTPLPTPTPEPTPTPTPTLEVPPIIKLPISAQDILKNGGFEQGRITGQWQRTGVVPNWNVGGTVDILGDGFPKCEGEQSLDLNGGEEGSINQTVRVVPGEYYILRFVTTLHTGISISSFSLFWNGQLVEEIDVDTRACKTHSYLVSSSNNEGTILFRSTSNETGRGVILDNIRLLEGDRYSSNRSPSGGRFQGTDISPPEDEIFGQDFAAVANVVLDRVIINIDDEVFNIKGRVLNALKITSIQIWHTQDEELRSLSCTTERPIGIIRKPPNVGTRYTVNEISYEWTYCPESGRSSDHVDQVPYIDPVSWQFNKDEFFVEAKLGDDTQLLSYSSSEGVVLYFFDENSLISRNLILF